MRSYGELVGFWSRGRKVDPPEFPAACPRCGAARNDDPETLIPTDHFGPKHPRYGEKLPIGEWGMAEGRAATYECGGYWREKPQIQNHTDYFWGRCQAPTEE